MGFRQRCATDILARMLTDELIGRRPSGRAGLAEWYGELFDAQRAEDLSVADLAVLLEVTPTNIYYWRRRLRERGRKASKRDRGSRDAGLVRVKVGAGDAPERAKIVSSSFEVRLSCSRSIVVSSGFDSDVLRDLVRTLEAC